MSKPLNLARAMASAVVLGLTSPALGQTPPAGSAGATLIPAQEKADQEIVLSALKDFNTGSYAALRPRLAEVQAVLDRAPKAYPKVDIKNGVALLRADSSEVAALSLLVMAQAASAKPAQSLSVSSVFDTYPIAALLLGSTANEDQKFAQAIIVLERGLALQPDFVQLMGEKGYALGSMKRWADSLAMYEKGLLVTPLVDENRALMLRGKGAALMELSRFDEAERAYQDSLKIQPGNAIALNQLNNIATRRKAQSGQH